MSLVWSDEFGWLVDKDDTGESFDKLRDVLRKERIRQGFTIADLQRRMGIAHPIYYNYEIGKSKSTAIPFRALEHLGFTVTLEKDVL